MNMMEIKENKTYQRKADKRFFKKENKQYFVADDKGIWTVTTEISLNDDFEEKSVNFKKSLTQLYTDWKTGDISVSNRAYQQMLLRLCQMGDELEKSAEVPKKVKKVIKKK